MTTYAITLTGSLGAYELVAQGKAVRELLIRNLGEPARLQLECKNIDYNHCMDTVEFAVDGTTLFTGTVRSQRDYQESYTKKSTLLCVDNAFKLQRRIVAETYADQTIKEVITDLQGKYATWMTLTNLQDLGAAVDTRRFDYVSLYDVIQNLADEVGAYWYVDAANDLHFFMENDGAAAISYVENNNILLDSFTLDTTAMDLSNRVWVLGARAASATYIDQYWTGDGGNSLWTTLYIPNYPEVTEGGVAKTIEVERGDVPGSDYTYDKKNKVLKRVAGALGNGVSLQLHYKPTIQVIDYFEDQPSVVTYGLYEKVIRDRKITDKAAARKRGRAALKRTKQLARDVSFRSRDWNVAPGQLATVDVTSYGFDSPCRINSISVSFTPADIEATIEAQEVAT